MLIKTLLAIPYTILWHLVNLLSRDLPLIIYCKDLTEWYVMEPIHKHLPEDTIVIGNRSTTFRLAEKNIKLKRGLVFPKSVIMCNNHTGIFPCKSIKMIGVRYGAYHFKEFKKSFFNHFDLYLFSSQADLEAAQAKGIDCGKVGGFPKLDPAFDGTYDDNELCRLKDRIGMDRDKTTILLSATWYRSDASAITEWYKKLHELTKFYNVLVTLHSKMDRRFVSRIKRQDSVVFIEDDNILPYIMISDVCVSDTSSIIAEFSALDKPIITFRIPHTKKLYPQTIKIIDKISYRINYFEQLILAIEYSIKNRSELTKERACFNNTFFDKLDGQSGKRCAEVIKQYLQQ